MSKSAIKPSTHFATRKKARTQEGLLFTAGGGKEDIVTCHYSKGYVLD